MIRNVVLAAMLAVATTACDGAGMTFDKAAWAAERGNYKGENRRATMVSKLDDAGVVRGATREAVRDMLGAPDSTGPEADIYYLGRSRSGPSFEAFRIDYDADGVVTATALRRS